LTIRAPDPIFSSAGYGTSLIVEFGIFFNPNLPFEVSLHEVNRLCGRVMENSAYPHT
jgi:hypothetical protein